MITPELRAYVQKRVAQGASQEEIAQTLNAAGWQEEDIRQALGAQPSKNRARFLPVLIASLIGIFVLGGGAFAFWYFTKDPPPEEVIARMMEESGKIKSFAYSGGIRIEVGEKALEDGTFFDLGGVAGFLNVSDPPLTPPEEGTIVISMDFNGVAGENDPKTPKAHLSLDMRVDTSPEGKFAVGVETRVIGEDIYAKLTRFEFDPAVPFLDGVILLLKDQWFKVDQKALKELNGYGAALSPDVSEFSEEELKRLKEALKNARIIRITQTLPNDTIEGVKTFHYKFALDKEGLRSYIVEVMNIVEAKNLNNEEIRQIKEIFESEEFNKVLDMIVNGFKGDIWIGKKDFFPYRVSAALAFKYEASQKDAATISFLFTMKDFNKPVSVEDPANAKSLEALLEELFASPLIKNRDAKRISDLQNMRTALAVYYSDTNSYPARLNDLAPNYLPSLAKDPLEGEEGCNGEFGSPPDRKYKYSYTSRQINGSVCETQKRNCETYMLQACLEDATNPALESDCDDGTLIPACADKNVYDIRS